VKLRESEVQGGISKWVVVQGGLVKFPFFFFSNFGLTWLGFKFVIFVSLVVIYHRLSYPLKKEAHFYL
jgi:hypothetical protein